MNFTKMERRYKFIRMQTISGLIAWIDGTWIIIITSQNCMNTSNCWITTINCTIIVIITNYHLTFTAFCWITWIYSAFIIVITFRNSHPLAGSQTHSYKKNRQHKYQDWLVHASTLLSVHHNYHPCISNIHRILEQSNMFQGSRSLLCIFSVINIAKKFICARSRCIITNILSTINSIITWIDLSNIPSCNINQ